MRIARRGASLLRALINNAVPRVVDLDRGTFAYARACKSAVSARNDRCRCFYYSLRDPIESTSKKRGKNEGKGKENGIKV